jgi:CTP:molybdopterin cytidylyltransferase MocA
VKSVAIIVAAGLSSRMGKFKPLLPFNKEPTIVYLTQKFFNAGVGHVIIVTGHRSEDLMAACSDLESLTFIKNEAYATTQMLDSAVLGIKEAQAMGADHILFTPVDVPLIAEETIRLVMEAPGKIVFPTYGGQQGHPLKLDQNYFNSIVDFKGQGGMRGAIDALNAPIAYLEVEDPFIFKDMDTPEDYRSLLNKVQRKS